MAIANSDFSGTESGSHTLAHNSNWTATIVVAIVV